MKKTNAYLQVEATRRRMLENKDDLECVECDELSCAVYTYKCPDGTPAAIAFKGRRKKAVWHRRFVSVEVRRRYVRSWMAKILKDKQAKDSRKQQMSLERELSVGDVVYSSWGYEQTNISYWKVVKLIGKQSVELVKIGSDSKRIGDMDGEVVPRPDIEVGESFVRRVKGKNVRIDSYLRASLLEPVKVVAGVKIYKPMRWSSYY